MISRLREIFDEWNPFAPGKNADAVEAAFMRGAAAMAELFATGQAIKVEAAPRPYFTETWSGNKPLRNIVYAYSRREARERVSESDPYSGNAIFVRVPTDSELKELPEL